MSAKDDILPILWETLQRLLFAVVMSLQGIITNIMHSRIGTFSLPHYHFLISGLPFYTQLRRFPIANLDGVPVTMEILEILRCLAFVSTRFGYSAFQEYNFVYLSSIDILASQPSETMTFIQRHIPLRPSAPQTPSTPHTPFSARITHPAVKADTLFFLD